MASYKQLAKNNWRATLSLGYDYYGKRIKQQKQGFKTKKDAERWVTDIQKISIEKTKIKFWEKCHVDFFLNKIKESYLYTPILLELMTGLRIGELCGLRWCDIDFNNNFLTVNNQIIIDKNNRNLIFTPKLKTNTSYRRISIPKTLTDYLLSVKGNAPNNDFVILNRDGKTCNPRNLSMHFKKEIQKYKEPVNLDDYTHESDYMQLPQITFHGLRHTHATILITNNENIKVVSKRLGHTNVTETLNTYTHVMEDIKNNTGELLSNIFDF